MRIYVPLDSAAKALGAEVVVATVRAEALRRGLEVTVVRNGSRGMVWLEPLLEVDSAAGRMAFGPVGPGDVAGLFDAGFGAHDKALGLTDDLPWMKAQTRLTFARVGVTDPLDLADYEANGGLVEVPFGVTLRELVVDYGGGTHSGRPIKAIQVGGPLGAWLPPAKFDLPLDYEAVAQGGGN
ncbi:MAG: hypothetical protein ACK446_01075, partial [Rhodobacterales bacterium]